MRKHAGFRRIGDLLVTALLALALAALPLHAAAAGGQGGEDGAAAVRALLGQLQRVDISPAWPPDIQANENAVQALLDAWLACTDDERAAFTDAEKADLRAYFEALYAVQGKDAAGVDALFAAPAVEAPPPVPSEVTGPDEAASSAASEAAPAPAGQAGASEPTAMPRAENQPEVPSGGGWLGFFSNQGLGATLVVVLAGLALALFVRFVIALRRAGKAPRDDGDATARAQELFGENYAASAGMELLNDGALPAAPRKAAKAEAAKGGETAALPPAPRKAAKAEAAKGGETTAPPPAPGGKAEAAAPAATSPKPSKKAEKAARPTPQNGAFNNAAVASLPPDDESPSPGGGPAFRNARAAFGKTVRLPDPDTGAPPEAEAPAPPPKEEPTLGRNPDKAEPIVMRSFSAPPRTGRPVRMPFRQGDPDDLDAIDE